MKKVVISFTFLLFSLTIQSQIVVTQTDIENHLQIGNGILNYSDTIGIDVDIGTPGENSWDFENHPFHLEFDVDVVDPGSTPKADLFSSATHALITNYDVGQNEATSYTYLIIEDGNYGEDGLYFIAGVSSSTSEVTIENDPPGNILQFPVNYQDSWTTSHTKITTTELNGVPISNTEAEETSSKLVDGYGTIVLPDGTTEEALRIKIEGERTVNGDTEEILSFMFITRSGASLTAVADDPNGSDNGVIQTEQVNWNYGNGSPSSVDKIEELANDFVLSQNYPNPFNPTTNIQYSIPKASHVSLKVYDVLGNEVATLVNEKLSSGVYNSKFDASTLSSGIYFYTLEAGNFVTTKKLSLIK
ncbi:MAG: T9SS type A sorting domain-containing protein [Melioribacteraceae bacterium]|nr:T9SS type A sorting domain-containing protein [Melioribacteraceae bacterium]